MKTTHQNEQDVVIQFRGVALFGTLSVPSEPQALIIFVHGSGSSRFSPRNQEVASFLNRSGFATLLFDLLTPNEEAADHLTYQYRFDIPLLADRLCGTLSWVRDTPGWKVTPIGLFGSSTGAAAALIAAARMPDLVASVVSRGGRPDLACEELCNVQAPTLLIVGEFDQQVINLNREAARLMPVPPRIEIVPGATHLFEEPGKLEQVARLASNWFHRTTTSADISSSQTTGEIFHHHET